MAMFALGEAVADEKGRMAIVRAAFLSREGQQHYAVEQHGAINFVEERKLTGAAPADRTA
jgi:hypothetical protein